MTSTVASKRLEAVYAAWAELCPNVDCMVVAAVASSKTSAMDFDAGTALHEW